MVKIYGIKNCDTMKKAFDWLKENKIPYEFHDYRELGVPAEKLNFWLDKAPKEVVVNLRSTTWKNFTDQQKECLNSREKLIPLIQENSSALKRPIVESGEYLLIGFDKEKWKNTL